MSFPSKKFIVVIIGTIVIGTGLFFVLNFFNTETTFTQNDAGTPPANQQDDLSLFENIAGEDAGPFGAGIQNYNGESGNLTEAFSKELLTALILKGNAEIRKEDISSALAGLFEESSPLETPRVYSRINIRETKSGAADLKKYGNTFMETVAAHARANATDALNTFERMLEAGDESLAKTLWLIAEEYRKMESDILSIPAPGEIAPLHVDFVNELRAIGNTVTDMGFAVSDPVRGTLGLSQYIKRLDRAWEILNRINQIFESEAIEFAPNELGYAWKRFKN